MDCWSSMDLVLVTHYWTLINCGGAGVRNAMNLIADGACISIAYCISLYLPSMSKKVGHLYVYDNFSNSGPIFITISLLRSPMGCSEWLCFRLERVVDCVAGLPVDIHWRLYHVVERSLHVPQQCARARLWTHLWSYSRWTGLQDERTRDGPNGTWLSASDCPLQTRYVQWHVS